MLSDSRTTIMTDGFFSRPSIGQLLRHPVLPDRERIETALRTAELETVSAIFVAHSHHDHAMDAPYVAQMTGATIVGSSSTANIALGVDFPEDRIQRIEGGSVCRFGDFTVTIFRTPHSEPKPFPGRIDKPLGRSARVWHYRVGGNFTFHVAHPLGDVLVVPSMGVRNGWTILLKADFVFLGVGGLVPSKEKLRTFWRQFVEGSGAKTVYPIHWDDFFKPFGVDAGPDIPKRLRTVPEFPRTAELSRGRQEPRTAQDPRFGARKAAGSRHPRRELSAMFDGLRACRRPALVVLGQSENFRLYSGND